MASRARIARPDGELANYFNSATPYLNARFRDTAADTVDAGNTVNVPLGPDVPMYMKVLLENTGAPGSPDLLFCMAANEGVACVVGSSVQLAVGTSQLVTIKTMGGTNLNTRMNVTNAGPLGSTSFRITFERNWERLGLVEDQALMWLNFSQDWLERYNLSINTNTKTKTIVEEKNQLRKDFTAFAEPVLNHISSSLNIVAADRNTLNLPARDRSPSARPAITEEVVTILQTEPGCNIRFTHRTIGDGSRSSILPISNGVEIRWIILPLGTPAPETPEDCTHSFIATKSIHNMAFGIENTNKRFHAFFRWVNTSDPSKNGPWSEPMTTNVVN